MRNKVLLLMFITAACHQQDNRVPPDFYSSELFHEVQLQAIFPDSKTFVDCVPKHPITEVLEAYENEKSKADFNLKQFVTAHFDLPDRPVSVFESDTLLSMEEHLARLWPILTRKADERTANSSLIALPRQYIVPGGRFSEIYYWDSYFTMLGLKVHKRFDLIEDMVNNFAYLIDTLGFIPNGNRNYYLSRSQPPFFSLMVKLLEEKDSLAASKYLRALQKEYAFWMNGADRLQKPGDAFEHVVYMPDGTILNRYFDKRPQPRPEAYKEDVRTAQDAGKSPEMGRNPEEVYTALRSAAESGWDFSSRWFGDGRSLGTIQTTELIPVDLNCLLYHLEQMISSGLMLEGKATAAAEFKRKADLRRRAVLTFCWDADARFFMDYDYKDGRRSGIKSLAGVFPLFFNIASPEVAQAVAGVLEEEFLKPGGLTTTLVVTGQQWDAPNGWAPLQWMAYLGLKNYGIDQLAVEIRERWLDQNRRVYEATGKMMEKYNVMDTTLVAGGGEYPNQDGFGWTNGVALAMMADR